MHVMLFAAGSLFQFHEVGMELAITAAKIWAMTVAISGAILLEMIIRAPELSPEEHD